MTIVLSRATRCESSQWILRFDALGFQIFLRGVSMQTWSLGSWRWLRSRGISRSRLRRHQPDFSPVAAAVESLESRALLSITYHGGALISSIELQPVFLGSDWNNPANAGTIATINSFSSTIVKSSFMDELSFAG
jgi:hypothetical protein